MTLVAGCYERFLFGFRCEIASDGQGASLVRTFNYPAHKNAVKCLASAGSTVASGGADDLIHLYDIQNGRDLGFLMNPGDGAVSCLDFHQPAGSGPSHLLNGSTDGSISVWQAGSWDCLKTMEGHKGAVNSISVHPSGSVALSVGRDRELRVWNLVKGRVMYHSKLAAEADHIEFLPGGDAYALCVGRDVTLHSTEGAGTQLADMPHPKRVLTMAFAGGNLLLTGCEDGSVRLWDSRSSKAVMELPRAHSTRVRGVAAIRPRSSAEAGESAQMAASAATDGVVRLWDLRSTSSARPLAEEQTSARLTCLEYVSPTSPASKQPKQPKLQEKAPSRNRVEGAARQSMSGKQSRAAEVGSAAILQGPKAKKRAAVEAKVATQPELTKALKRKQQAVRSQAAAEPQAAKKPATAKQPPKALVAKPSAAKAATGSKKQKERLLWSVPDTARGVVKRGVVEFAAEEEAPGQPDAGEVNFGQAVAEAKRKKSRKQADSGKSGGRPKLDLSRFD